MAWPLWDLAGDLAVARGGGPVNTDPMERVQGGMLRRRIAALLWIPGAFGAVAIWSGLENWIAGVVAFAVLVVILWLFAERADWIWARLRRKAVDSQAG